MGNASRAVGFFLISCLYCFAANLKAEEVVHIGAEDDWYPYSGVIDGKVQGLTIDLVREAFKAVNVTVKYEVLPYSRCMAMAKRGRLAGCFDTLRNPLLEDQYLWHEKPMFTVQYQIYALSGSEEKNLRPSDLEGKRVAVTNAYEYGPEFDANPRIVRYVSPRDETNFRMLIAGRIQYTVAMDLNTQALVKKFPELKDKFKIVGQVSESGVYTVFSKQSPQGKHFMKLFDKGMSILRESGRYKRIRDEWRRHLGEPRGFLGGE